MPDELHSTGDFGELKFEFDLGNRADDDSRFISSAKNLLVLIKDFHGANSSAIFWFNKNKNSFKLLASSEDEQWSNYNGRFGAGNDALTKSCSRRSSDIYENIEETGMESFPCFKNAANVKSVVVNPVEVNNEVVAFVICESRTEKFFANPNIYSLQVFSDSVVNLINYYTLKEEYDVLSKKLKKLAAGSIFDGEIEGIYSKEYFMKRLDSEMNRCRQFNSNELVVVSSSADFTDSIKETGISLVNLVTILAAEIRTALTGYDMIFRTDENLISIIIQTEKTESVLVELEKIRKFISTKIYKLQGKEISFTASFAFKKYDNHEQKSDDYLNEISEMLKSAANEGGNVIKY